MEQACQEAILQEKLPKSMVVIGSSAIDVKFSTMWNSYGMDVTIVEMLPRIVSLEDGKSQSNWRNLSRSARSKFWAGTKLRWWRTHGDGCESYGIRWQRNQDPRSGTGLVVIDFHPNSKSLDLEDAGVNISERGFVEIDERMQTNLPGIYAVGNVTAN
jgi:dihydrolipoamide dehydrogenase